jgi:heme/copper-type cytochrome/quinol oxidase subunit 3
MSAHAAADDHHELVYPDDPVYSRITAGKVGMWLFLLSDGFSFGGLLLAYGILRGGSDYWGCVGETVVAKFACIPEPSLGIYFTALLTFMLICSSVTMVLAHAAAVEGDRQGTMKWLAATILGGAMFLCGQYQEYWGIVGHGLIGGITGFHGMHVTTGVLYLTAMLAGTALGKTNANTIEVAGLFWHFVDLVWILVFTFVYLIPQG